MSDLKFLGGKPIANRMQEAGFYFAEGGCRGMAAALHENRWGELFLEPISFMSMSAL